MQHEYSRKEQGIHNPDPGNTYCEDSVLVKWHGYGVGDRENVVWFSGKKMSFLFPQKPPNTGCGAQTVSCLIGRNVKLTSTSS